MKKTAIKLFSLLTVCALLTGCASGTTVSTTTTGESCVDHACTTTATEPATTTSHPISTTIVKKPTTTSDGLRIQSTNLMTGIKADTVSDKTVSDEFAKTQTKLALDLFKAALKEDDDNVLVSPLSAQLALALVANGANGKTLQEMESVLGGGMKIADLNKYLHSYVNGLPSSENCSLNIANAIWFQKGINVKKDFLRTNATYYGAAAYQSKFDKQTVKDINNWVSRETSGKITELVDDLDAKKDMMLLANAMYFDGAWDRKFHSSEVRMGIFTTEDGKKNVVESMQAVETMRYFDDGRAIGFAKNYGGKKYSFVALLPKDDVTVDEYVAGMTADGIRTMLANATTEKVWISLPKFHYDYEMEMDDALQTLGMKTAFTNNADFSKLTNDKVWVDEVKQKTIINLDEQGTSVAAATTVRVTKGATTHVVARVNLNRPFAYMIVDNTNNLPLFIGTVKKPDFLTTDVANAYLAENTKPTESVDESRDVTRCEIKHGDRTVFSVGVPNRWKSVSGWKTLDTAQYKPCEQAVAGMSVFLNDFEAPGKDLLVSSYFAVKREDAVTVWEAFGGNRQALSSSLLSYTIKDGYVLQLCGEHLDYTVFSLRSMDPEFLKDKSAEEVALYEEFSKDVALMSSTIEF